MHLKLKKKKWNLNKLILKGKIKEVEYTEIVCSELAGYVWVYNMMTKVSARIFEYQIYVNIIIYFIVQTRHCHYLGYRYRSTVMVNDKTTQIG